MDQSLPDAVAPEPSAATAAANAAASSLVANHENAAVRRWRATDQRAADLVAEQVAQDATATRYRAEADAARVRRAVQASVERVWQMAEDPTDAEAQRQADAIEFDARAAALLVQARTDALATSVAEVAAHRAAELRSAQLEAYEQREAEASSTIVAH